MSDDTNPNVMTITDDDTPAQQAPAPGKDEAPAVQQPSPEPEASSEEEKAKRGTKFVELPEEVEARFKRIYGNLKATQRDNEKLFAANQRLIDRLDQLEQAQAQRQTTGQMGDLKAAYANALATADYQRAADIQEQMLELKTAAKDAGVKIPDPVAQPQPTEPELDLSQQETATVVAWGSATDDNGQPLRPWANPAHPKFQRFRASLQAVTNDPDFAGGSLATILGEVDRMMGAAAAPQRAAAPVLNSAPDASLKVQRNAPLSDAEKRAAVRMFQYTGVVKSEEEAHNLYRKNKSVGGSRSSASVVIED